MSLALIIAGGLALGGAVGVLVSRAPVHSVIALIVNLIGLAGLYLTLHAEFLAVVQVIVYAGAVMILFLFVIALLTVKREPDQVRSVRSVGSLPAKVLAAALVALLLCLAALWTDTGGSASVASEFGTVRAMGDALFLVHVLAFEVSALVLLVAVLGVVVLVGRRQGRGSE